MANTTPPTNKSRQVAQAAIALINAGEKPTQAKIRHRIGGSPNDIGPLFNAWKASPEGAAALERLKSPALPVTLESDDALDEALLASLLPLRSQLRAEGQQAASTLEAEKNAEIAELRMQLTNMRAEKEALENDLRDLKEAHQLLDLDHAGALKTIEEMKEAAIRSEEQNQALKSAAANAEQATQDALARASKAEALTLEERQRLEQAREIHLSQLDSLRNEHTNEKREIENQRTQALEAQQAMENRLNEMQKTQALLEQERNQLRDDTLPRLEERVGTLGNELSSVKETNSRLDLELRASEKGNAAKKIVIEHLEAAQLKDRESITRVEKQLSDYKAELDELKTVLLDKDKQLMAMMDKLTISRADNKK